MKTFFYAAFALFVGQLAFGNCEPQMQEKKGSEIKTFFSSVAKAGECCNQYDYQSIEWFKCIEEGGTTGC